MPNSPFLEISSEKWIASNELAFAIRDGYPVTLGHSLVITKRIVATWFDASPDEQAAVMTLVNTVKQMLDQELAPKPNGYNVGFNCGEAAGQTIPHLHVHIIPRYDGDVPDPRGGVRYVIPDKANYLTPPKSPATCEHDSATATSGPTSQATTLSVGYPKSPLWDQLAWRIPGAKRIDILASFVQVSGLDVIENRLCDALRNGAHVRILVSDYLYISDPRALSRLLAWSELAWSETLDEECREPRLQTRLVEIKKLPDSPASFHPKAWRIVEEHREFISVGSSNLSKPALITGVEWNLLSTAENHVTAHADLTSEFESLWGLATTITEDVISGYAATAKQFEREHFVAKPAEHQPIPVPRPWQANALASLADIRRRGHTRALVAVATGMGKTWLAAFDACQVGEALERRPRVLIVAHRAHILAQAERTISQLLDHHFAETETGWYIGNRDNLDSQLVVASIQKLSRPEGLEQLAAQHFDYAIIDEVHHAHAPTYRRVLAKLDANFVLGLTATPERTDGVDVATIFDDNLAYHASIGDGIAEESLVPFHYIGIKDTVDFGKIPWRNGRFDLAELEAQVARSERMVRLWQELEKYESQRTLLFCCSRRHALFARDWLLERGVAAAAVFSGEGSDSYGDSLQRFRSGELNALCVVDMFNEGLDIPAVDRVVMLRPTESKVIFLQQLGRGLRAAEGKSRLLVIDFVGNHRVFAQRILHLLSLRSGRDQWSALRDWLNGEPPDLPDCCLLDVELDAKDLLKQFLPRGKAAAIEGYRALRDDLGRRPTVPEVFHRGFLPRTISAGAGSWFRFVADEGDLSPAESQVAKQFDDWLKTVETTNLNKCYKMVVLRVLIDAGQAFSGMDVYELSKQSRRFLQNHEVLRHDLQGQKHALDHENATDEEWAEWWIKWPIGRWLAKQGKQVWFTRDGNRIRFQLDCSEYDWEAFESLTTELIDWRLASYCQRRSFTDSNASEDVTFRAKVSHAGGRPILFVPEKSKLPGRPVGPTDVTLPNGDSWEFKFVKVACNIAKPAGTKKNQLADLLREWFGENAGLPGTGFHVEFTRRNNKWEVKPIDAGKTVAQTIETASQSIDEDDNIVPSIGSDAKYRTHVPVYDLTVAAGNWGPQGVTLEIGWLAISGHELTTGMFAARVTGQSMEPRIPSDSWCLFRPCPAGSRQGRLLLVQVNTHADPEDGGRYTVKRYHSIKQSNPNAEESWTHATIQLQPLNPEYAPIDLQPEDADDMRVIGEFVTVISSIGGPVSTSKS